MKIEEKAKELFEETENGIFLIEIEKGKLCLSVKGENMRLANMLREAFDSRPDFFELVEMTVEAYKDLQEFKKLSTSEKADKIVESLEKLKRTLN
jgi:DNA-directed RNA polymerase subunit L